MENGKPKTQNLADAIKRHCPAPMRDDEAVERARNLQGFFELLIEIDQEHGITRPYEGQGQS